MLQEILVFFIVFIAVGYSIFNIFKSFKSNKTYEHSNVCESCNSCQLNGETSLKNRKAI